jgi:hypothetical protein
MLSNYNPSKLRNNSTLKPHMQQRHAKQLKQLSTATLFKLEHTSISDSTRTNIAKTANHSKIAPLSQMVHYSSNANPSKTVLYFLRQLKQLRYSNSLTRCRHTRSLIS